jgi:electron transfer flavoprotein beta subunit
MYTSVVCMKICVDTSQLVPDPQSGAPRLEQAALRIGACDENALEAAVRLKEQHGGRVVALALVPREPPPEVLLKALAMGVDEAVLVQDATAADADPLAAASVLAAALRKLGRWDLVLCGEGSGDQYNRQVGPRIAEALGVPSLTHVSSLRLCDAAVWAERALEDRIETVEADRPAVVTVTQEINQPRLPTVLQIKGSARKPITRWRLADLGFGPEQTAAALSGVRTLECLAPRARRRRTPVQGESAGQAAMLLARALLEEGVVGLR